MQLRDHVIDPNGQLAAIRKAMSAALRERPKNIAEYHRLGAEHRRILHTANPSIKSAWEASRDARP